MAFVGRISERGGPPRHWSTLEAAGRCVTGEEKSVADEPFGEGHVMGGYFVVSASSLEEVTDLAKGCPVLQSGGTVEIRPIMDAE
jgi:hypothetical protein